ncbi:MAG: MBOAT family protein [Bacteroidaceae bacterium]|nr:MBOAT family protein [Bacteroidaceae bacterium]
MPHPADLLNYILGIFAFDPHSPLLFTQFHFWAFFSIVFAGFALLQSRRLLRVGYLLFVSLLFYYKTSGLFVGLLMLVTLSDFLIARHIHRLRWEGRRQPDDTWKARALLCLSVAIDLGILCYFKYSYFFADVAGQILGTEFHVSNVAALCGNALVGCDFFDADRIVLPVGISFYTFQVISYTADVYRGEVRPVRSILDFGFYVSFFPQLVAGPIVKASDFIPQLYRRYWLSRRQFGIAVFWILNGLAKKIILSDYLAVNFIDRVFNNPTFFCGFENLSALFLYSLQVYADFSGYTDIAIGLAMLMGFYLPTNFNSPYKATNASNFWKRWHISLSRWLQTYLYIPLGGNRRITRGTYFWIATITLFALMLSGSVWLTAGVLLTALLVVYTVWRRPDKRKSIYANLNAMITMLLGGLWHGASLNFMVWGGLNGAGMVVFKFWRDLSLLRRALLATLLALVCHTLMRHTLQPVWTLFYTFSAFIAVSAWVRWAWRAWGPDYPLAWLERGWATLVTFVFITFTRLFFRSGSNLDPAVANETAWRIASDMILSIATQWDVNVLTVIATYRSVFLLFVAGMAVHWLPSRLKRRYRIAFARLPLPCIVLVSALVVFVCYQFITAEMQPFIYLQF